MIRIMHMHQNLHRIRMTLKRQIQMKMIQMRISMTVMSLATRMRFR